MQEIEADLQFKAAGYVLGEPLIAIFRMRNPGTTTLEVDLGHRRKELFAFSLDDPERRTIHKTKLPAEGGASPLAVVSIPAQQTYEQPLHLDEWFSICIPGQYELEWEGPLLLSVPGGMLSGKASFLLGPRDASYLEQLCAHLEETARNGNIPACYTLSWVRDPIAIPYIVRLCREFATRNEFFHGLLLPMVSAGLRRIGTEEAVQALKQVGTGADRMILRGEEKRFLIFD